MKKCTLCVDRIYNENVPEESRVPACVAACPTGARSFGDLGDADSDVSRLVKDRGGYDLMPEQGCSPANKYLPPKPRNSSQAQSAKPLQSKVDDFGNAVLKWIDLALSR